MEAKGPTVLIAVANGCEDMEVIIPLTVLKKACANVVLAKVSDTELDLSLRCTLGRGTRILCDTFIDSLPEAEYEMIITPGGRPGMDTLSKNHILLTLLQAQKKSNKWYCATSAASAVVLGSNGLLDNESATTYPGFDYLLKKKDSIKSPVVVSHKASIICCTTKYLVTSKGPAHIFTFTLELVKALFGEDKSVDLLDELDIPL